MTTRPERFNFAMEVVGDPEAAEVIAYVESLEKACATLDAEVAAAVAKERERTAVELRALIDLDGFGCACSPRTQCGTCKTRSILATALSPAIRARTAPSEGNAMNTPSSPEKGAMFLSDIGVKKCIVPADVWVLWEADLHGGPAAQAGLVTSEGEARRWLAHSPFNGRPRYAVPAAGLTVMTLSTEEEMKAIAWEQNRLIEEELQAKAAQRAAI